MPIQNVVTPHTILLKGQLSETHDEAKAAAALSPGHIIKKNSSDQVLKHATAGAGGQIWVAMEDRLIGRTINDAYATAETVFYHIPEPGDWLFCRIAASAVAIALNDPLTSDGAGCLKKATGGDVVLAHAREAKDNSAGGTEVFIRAEFASMP